MQAVILAAGKGCRLNYLTEDKPKPLVKIKGVTMLGRKLNALLKIAEINEIIIVTGHMTEQIEEFVKKNYSSQKIKLVYNEDYQKGSVLTILKAEPFIKEGFLLLNADHLFSSKVYQKVVKEVKDVMVCSFRNRTPADDEMKIKFNLDNTVEMSKKHLEYDCGYTGLTVIGDRRVKEYFKIAQKVLAEIGEQIVVENLILPLSQKNIPIQNCDLSNFTFVEVDNPEDFKIAQKKITLVEAEEEGLHEVLLNYKLSGINSIESPKLGGYLNQNFVIETINEKYFLQKINNKFRKNISAEIEAIKFLQMKQFPSLELIKNKKGDYKTFFEGDYFILSKFIDGYSPLKFNELSDSQIIEAARNLARYHKLIANYSYSEFSNPNTASKEEAIKICNQVNEFIGNKETLDNFDLHVKKMIDKKLNLLQELPELEEKLSKCPRIFCHGDYHGANLIFDSSDKIKSIVDWEFFGYDYRIWEVMRSMSFICDLDFTGSMVGPVDFKKAFKYLKAYLEELPLLKEELNIAVELMKYKSLCSCFVIEQHYFRNKTDSGVFLPKEPENWFWWLNNGNQFEKEVIDNLSLNSIYFSIK